MSFICLYLLANPLGIFKLNHIIPLIGDGKSTFMNDNCGRSIVSLPYWWIKKIGKVDKHWWDCTCKIYSKSIFAVVTAWMHNDCLSLFLKHNHSKKFNAPLIIFIEDKYEIIC